MSSPVLPAKAISTSVVKRPPSERSWYAKINPGFVLRIACETSKNTLISCASTTSGASDPTCLNTCATAEPPSRCLPRARSKNTSEVGTSRSVRSCGVHVLLTSSTAANAVTMSESGALTSRFLSPCCHFIDMLIESLPTGMPTPSAGHSSIPTALTASYRAAPSPSLLAAHIQFALSLTRPRSPTWAAARFVSDSATAMRADAAAFRIASGVRSPMAMASPVRTSKPYADRVTATSATGTCHGPTIWSRVTRPVIVRSPMVIKNDLEPTEGRRKTLLTASLMRADGGKSERYSARSALNGTAGGATCLSVRCMRGGLPKSVDILRRMTSCLSSRSVTTSSSESFAMPTIENGHRSRSARLRNRTSCSGAMARTYRS